MAHKTKVDPSVGINFVPNILIRRVIWTCPCRLIFGPISDDQSLVAVVGAKSRPEHNQSNRFIRPYYCGCSAIVLITAAVPSAQYPTPHRG